MSVRAFVRIGKRPARYVVCAFLAILLQSCSLPAVTPSPVPTATVAATATAMVTPSPTALPATDTLVPDTPTPLPTLVPTATTVVAASPTIAPTLAPTATTRPVPTSRIVPTTRTGPTPPVARRTVTPTPGGTAAASRISEGVHVTGADAWQRAGITGKGVKVGVIDTSFNAYRRFLGGVNITVRSFRRDKLIEDPQDPDGAHGTACAEIVHEMAPDAALYFVAEDQRITTQSEALFADEVDWLINNGVTIISYSVGLNSGVPHDGTSGYDKVIDAARARGVFFAIAASNSGSGDFRSDSAEGHFSATFTDADQDGFHDFDGSNAITVHIGRDPVTIDLNWEDWAMPHTTYGLYLYDANGKEVARSVDRIGPGDVPTQEIADSFRRGTYTLRVRDLTPSVPPVRFDLYFDGAQFAEITPAGSIDVPADARGAVAVGQTDWQTDAVLPSSSHGPTTDGRIKPELVAPSCVTSYVYYATGDDETFCGTSAAAPHVAGAAALVAQANPTFTADDLLTFLQDHAKHLMGPDADPNTGGAGRLALGPPPQP